ncbi:MAG TPA: GspH/FimT family pseudopilin [Gemmatimonadales bacterium]|nr:GspH/FimT family pseudopilin [Gemmatimonadales bacterium]
MSSRGFTLVELMVVMAIGGVLAILGAPTLVTYVRTSALQAGARELATVINLGRQLAITQNTAVCVEVSGGIIRLRKGGCGGTIWTGPGTDGTGVIKISESSGLRISTAANVVFTALGAASPAGTFTVTHPVDGGTRTVVVAATGRVSVR